MNNIVQRSEFDSLYRDICQGAFYPVFQPIYGLTSQEASGLEVLTRWKRERHVEESFRMIEEHGLNALFTKVLFNKLTNYVDSFPTSFTFISVNVSPSHLSSVSFVFDVTPLLKACQQRGITLWLELTENTAYSSRLCDQMMTKFNVNVCKKLGAKIALDDFGVAYHREESIIRFIRPDIVKLDRSMLGKKSEQYGHVWNSLRNWKKIYQFELVAEGIETVDDLTFIKNQQIAYAQGYFLHGPTKLTDLRPNSTQRCVDCAALPLMCAVPF
ncbi:EAL domain-containing protein [Vibrio sp. M260121]|uniref:EAL domain-containing protein n=1 Tax=Vibrio sp. M260121 TaxID=3020897 RepID=UPI002F408B0C